MKAWNDLRAAYAKVSVCLSTSVRGGDREVVKGFGQSLANLEKVLGLEELEVGQTLESQDGEEPPFQLPPGPTLAEELAKRPDLLPSANQEKLRAEIDEKLIEPLRYRTAMLGATQSIAAELKLIRIVLEKGHEDGVRQGRPPGR